MRFALRLPKLHIVKGNDVAIRYPFVSLSFPQAGEERDSNKLNFAFAIKHEPESPAALVEKSDGITVEGHEIVVILTGEETAVLPTYTPVYAELVAEHNDTQEVVTVYFERDAPYVEIVAWPAIVRR